MLRPTIHGLEVLAFSGLLALASAAHASLHPVSPAPAWIGYEAPLTPFPTEIGDLGWLERSMNPPRCVEATPNDERGEDWQSFTLAKTAEEIEEDERWIALAANPGYVPLPPNPPPEHDRLAVRLAAGHVVGADWGFEATAAGAVAGVETRLATFLTYGSDGLDFYSGRVELFDRTQGWEVEAGDLYSEAQGFARGLRLVWHRSRHRPALAVFLPHSRSQYEEALFAYRDEIALGSRAAIAGEISSDGAWLVRGRHQHRRLALYGYLRDAPGAIGSGHGATFAFELPRGIVLQGGLSRVGGGSRSDDWRSLTLRVPLPLRAEASLETAETRSQTGSSRAIGLSLAAPAGPLHLRGRYQEREIEIFAVAGRSLSHRYREIQGAVAYGNRRLHLELQGVAQWFQEQDPVARGQLVASYELRTGTSVQLLASATERTELQSYRLRISQLLPAGFEVAAEYGDVPPFQSTSTYGTDWFDEQQVKLSVRRSWDLSTPGRGARVEGRVVESSGRPLSGVAVRLGSYRAYTDGSGTFSFLNVPAGSYDLAIEREGTPAHLAPVTPPTTLALDRSSRVSTELVLAPLGSVAGHVYLDRDQDAERDPGEGVAGIVVLLGDRATATAVDGSFSFHNVAAGSHRLRLPVERLAANVRAGGPSELEIGLPLGRSLPSLELRLVELQRVTRFQESP